MNKKIPVWVLVLFVFLGLNFTVLFGGLVHYVETRGTERLGKLGGVVKTIAEFPLLVRKTFLHVTNQETKYLLIDNRFPEIDGFKKNGVVQDGALNDNGYLLLSAYDKDRKQSTVKLIRIRDQKILHEWFLKIQELEDRQQTVNDRFDESMYRFLHPLLLDDGGITWSNFTPMFKLDACSKIAWVINGNFHHAVEKGPKGNIWVSSYAHPSSYAEGIFPGYIDHAVAEISPDGKVLFLKSVTKILEENGYRGLLWGGGTYEPDTVHLNDVQPALYSTEFWEKGDLLISIRNRSAVFLYRPSTDKVIWLKIGPWMHQHDPDFIGQSKISIFGNDMVITKTSGKGEELLIDGHNNIYLYDLADGSVSTPYSDVLKKRHVATSAEGLHEILENGDVFVEESLNGRLLRLSQKKVVWEFTAKVDDDTVGLLNWSRYLTHEQVKDILPVLEEANCL